jgi:serine/threonine protein kinase
VLQIASVKDEANKGKYTKLEDFKVIKVIDKGSFGKVFLVINKHSKELFAMKRINKDILIDKK